MAIVHTQNGWIDENPLGAMVEGMVRGQQLAMQLKRAADEHQAFLTNQALHNQAMSMEDIKNRMQLEGSARPVTNGAVEETPQGPMISGMPAITGDQPLPPVMRKADPSRTVKYKDSQGQTRDYELLTPEEQLQRHVAATTAQKHATATPIQTPAHLKALGLPDQIWVPNEHIYQYAQTTGQLQPMQTPKAYQDLGGPAQVPAKSLPSVMTTVGQAANREAANTRSENTNKTREKIAAEANQTREKVATGNQAAANQRAAARNATTIEAAGIRRDKPTAGQSAVEGRFETRRQDQAKKDMAAVQAAEDKVHAQRLQIGAMLNDPNTKDADRQAAVAKLKAAAFQIQSYQTRKASIAGAQTPPKAIQDKIPEGHQLPAPDGHVWAKKDGIVYFVK